MGAFKLGKMTLGSLFKKPETVMYPTVSKPQPAGLKGHIVLDTNKCILCGMCMRSCSTGCITVDKPNRTWSIDRFACVQCDYCVTVCPYGSLSMSPDYAPASTELFVDSFHVPEREKPIEIPADQILGESAEADAVKEDVDVRESAGMAKPASADDAGKSPEHSEEAAPVAIPAGHPPVHADSVLLSKIALMDPEKATKVREALQLQGE